MVDDLDRAGRERTAGHPAGDPEHVQVALLPGGRALDLESGKPPGGRGIEQDVLDCEGRRHASSSENTVAPLPGRDTDG